MTEQQIYTAMNAVMGDVQQIGKDQRVTAGPARFNFRGVDDVVNAVGPVLRRHKVIVVPHEVTRVEHERYTTNKDALMDGVTIVIRWRFYAEDGSFIEASSAGQSADAGDKAIPKAHSVAYRTVLLQALCIPTDEPDPDSSVHERGSAPAAPRVNERQTLMQSIKAQADRLGWSKDDVVADFSLRFPDQQFDTATVDTLGYYVQILEGFPTQAPLDGAS